MLTHVGAADQDLAARGLREASTFTDRTTAEHALADLQSAYGDEIHAWLANAKQDARLTLAGTFDDPVGRVLYRGSSEPVSGASAVAVLQPKRSAPLGYFIVTGFVAP